MEVLLMLVMGVMNIMCFIVGAKVGQTVKDGKDIDIPAIDTFKAVRGREEKREAKAEADRFATIMENIEKYDGTPFGQKDVPGR